MTEIGMDFGNGSYSGGWQSGMDLSEMHWCLVSNMLLRNALQSQVLTGQLTTKIVTKVL